MKILAGINVAPPRGVRGLKYNIVPFTQPPLRRTPSWGAWIEIEATGNSKTTAESHPLVGCVD